MPVFLARERRQPWLLRLRVRLRSPGSHCLPRAFRFRRLKAPGFGGLQGGVPVLTSCPAEQERRSDRREGHAALDMPVRSKTKKALPQARFPKRQSSEKRALFKDLLPFPFRTRPHRGAPLSRGKKEKGNIFGKCKRHSISLRLVLRPSRLASFDWREDLNRQMAVSFLGPETSALTPLSFPYPEHTSLHPHCYRAHRATILLRLHNRMWPPSPALATLHLQDSSQSGLWKMGVRPCRCPAPNVRRVPASLWVKARVLAMTANMVFPQRPCTPLASLPVTPLHSPAP